MAAAVASPVAPPQPGLWSSILAKASSSRAVLSKSVVILGDASSGKSTLLAALKGVAPNDADSGTDLALAHTAAEVRDDDGE